MKYIRTKDGTIIDVTGKKIVKSYYDMKPDEICVNCEYREADTIEGLCDYALYEERGIQQVKKFPEECDLEFIRDLFLRGLVKNLKFAVLTNDGIINKAKMNEKGE